LKLILSNINSPQRLKTLKERIIPSPVPLG
jgi:hypothetical protein